MLTVTFYSFKGGVGRSMLASNVAALLADAGQRVLLVDFDIEAPGLSYLPELKPERGGARGVVGYVLDSWHLKQAQDARRFRYEVPGFDGRLSFMPVGDVASSEFASDLARFHEKQLFLFYKQRDRGATILGYLHALREHWSRDFDYVLLDSRTGLTDVGGVCLRVLPDLVVMVTTLNRQNLVGTKQILGQIRGDSIFGTPVDAMVVVSMVPEESTTEIVERRAALREALGEIAASPVELPLRPGLLVRESPFYVRTVVEGQIDSLGPQYRSVARALRDRNPWDIERHVEAALKTLETRDGSAAEALLARLLDFADVPLPAPRRVGAINSIAAGLLTQPGDLAGRAVRQSTAVAALRGALALSWGHPQEHAMTLNNLANALRQLPGDAPARAANLAEAIQHYRAALPVYTRDHYPTDYAGTLNNLANALMELPGDAPARAANLAEAIQHYRAALPVYTRDRYPADHAMTLNNLAAALTELPGDAPARAANLAEAIQQFRAALLVRTRDRYPADHATTLNNLANALTELPGDAPARAANLAEAIQHYRAALLVRTRDRYPTDHAMTLNNLANALTKVPGDAPARAANLAEAIQHYRAALDVYTRDRYPTNHATTLNNLANALRELPGDAPARAANLAEAIQHYRAALDVYTRDRYPTNHAMTFNNLANALRELPGDAPASAANLAEAIQLYRAALDVFESGSFDHLKPRAQANLDAALAEQAGANKPGQTRRAKAESGA